jgi:serine/threonine protein kinase
LNKYYNDGMGFPESRVWNVFKALTNALGYIHYGIQDTVLGGAPKAGWQMLLHRDIAPKNIFINMLPNGKIRTMLGDFGCAIEYQNQGVFNVKTPFWGPPEKPQYGPWSDIWSLGGVIRSMVQLQGPAYRYGPLAFVENGYPENQFSSELLNCLRCTLQTDYRRRPTARVLGPALNERSHQAKYADVNYPDWYGDDPLSLW